MKTKIQNATSQLASKSETIANKRNFMKMLQGKIVHPSPLRETRMRKNVIIATVILIFVNGCFIKRKSKRVELKQTPFERVAELTKNGVDSMLLYNIGDLSENPYSLSFIIYNKGKISMIEKISTFGRKGYNVGSLNLLSDFFEKKKSFAEEIAIGPKFKFRHFSSRSMIVFISGKLADKIVISRLDINEGDDRRKGLLKYMYSLDSLLLLNAIDMNRTID